MRVYICDYATASPVILANRVMFVCDDVWCNWVDIDEDRFSLRVYSSCEDKGLSRKTLEQIETLVKPYLF